MQAADYRFVDVSGITIADKILPKTDGPDCGALPSRAEDYAFLYEAVNERGTSISPTYSDLTLLQRFTRLRGGIRSVTREPQQGFTVSNCWFDWNARGVVQDEEITGRSFEPLVLWPDLFPGVTTPLEFSYPNAVDDVRKMYRDIKRHEGYLVVGDGVTASGRIDVTITDPSNIGYPGYSESIGDIVGYDYAQDKTDSGYATPYYYFATTTYSNFSLSNPNQGIQTSTSDCILVLYVRVRGKAEESDWVSTKYFVKVFENPTISDINGEWPFECRSAAGFSSGSWYVDVKVLSYMLLLPFVGRTTLRNISWNWEPS